MRNGTVQMYVGKMQMYNLRVEFQLMYKCVSYKVKLENQVSVTLVTWYFQVMSSFKSKAK